MTSTLEQAVLELRHTAVATSREERLEAEYRLVRASLAAYHRPRERLAAWRARTGGRKSGRAFYRRCRELGRTG